MRTKEQWLEAIQQTRELWKGARHCGEDMLLNADSEKLGLTITCPFCILVREVCHQCIAKANAEWQHACSPYLRRISLSNDPEKRAMKILDDITDNLDEIMEAIENET